jgi:predicted metal-dependent phosphoesterase TrpH
MLPAAIIDRDVSRGIGIAAITDHNAIDAVEAGI